MAQKHKSAFTLVEVLIVILIIGILAGLIMLSSGSATDTAERTRCVADRRSLRSALYIFRVEKGGTTSADLSATLKEVLDKMFDNGQGTVSGDSEIDGICPSKGIYAVTISDDKYLIACSVHGGDGTGTGSGGSGTGGDGGGTGGGSDGGNVIDQIFDKLVNSQWENIFDDKAFHANKGDIFYHKDEYYVATGSDLGNVWTNGYVEPDAAGALWWNTQSNGGIVKVTGVVVDADNISAGQTFKRGDVVRLGDGSCHICIAATGVTLNEKALPRSDTSHASWYQLPQSQ
ncbi:prepilin-type N-terminal cleavage/methylation domain-containing protein [Cloacibacillus porcorum]|uniref:prepilin-type N-terminal cleavage/methylation domain-containing protein n=1 Tax=Cloacibacillus porcorum TaxID=1197717 RepID=UPI002672C973|nr:prepilin-type N-terminal cleavage/methylation domain-containing protein [Cloacibacillus porcorum]